MLRIVPVISVVVVILSGTAWAGIPEPDAMLYGAAYVQTTPAVQQDSIVIRARLSSGQEIGKFDFNDCNADGVRDDCERSCQASGCLNVPGCGTVRDTDPADGLLDDCPGNLYSLRIRMESTPSGITPSGTAAVLNPANPDVVQISMQIGGGPEQFVRNFLISERGKIRNLALRILNLTAFVAFTSCYSGPANGSPDGSCSTDSFAAADYDEDGDVDLHDYAFIQNNLVGS